VSSPLHQHHYQELQQALESMRVQVLALEPTAVLHQSMAGIQQLFQMQVLTLSHEELDSGVASRVRSVQTELHKQLQLLKVDMAQLQAARKPETMQQRREQLCDRLKVSISYCFVLTGQDKLNS
jgi:arginine deiminase